MVSKEDLANMHSALVKQTKGLICDAVSPLKSDINDLCARMDRQEKTSAQVQPSSSSMSPDVKQLIDGLDPAHRRISMSGFPEKMPASERANHIDKFVKSIDGFPFVVTTGTIFKGPKNNRKPTKCSFVEFSTTDSVRDALSLVKNKSFQVGDASITIKNALSKINGVRNYSLREAERMAKEHVSIGKDTITIDWKAREVKKGLVAIFVQLREKTKGTFQGDFSTLSLP